MIASTQPQPGETTPLLAGQMPDTERNASLAQRPLSERMKEVVVNYLPLSWITFGGPQAHIALLFDLFVTRKEWLSEKTFAEIFAISNAIPGPAGTKLAFTLALARGGLFCGLVAFFLWSIPGGIVMFFVGWGMGSLGSGQIPPWVTHVQNGLSAVAVALVALAAYKMGCKILTDNIGRILAITAAAIVINYTSVVWVIPVAMVAGGIITTLEDRLPVLVQWLRSKRLARRHRESTSPQHCQDDSIQSIPSTIAPATNTQLRHRTPTSNPDAASSTSTAGDLTIEDEAASKQSEEVDTLHVSYSLRSGLITVAFTFIILIVAIALRSVPDLPRPIAILGTFYFVGMIIFGGGTVVVPLLYSYVVTNGWLSDSEFLFGLAFINIMPGPNFNFAAYCGALALRGNFFSSFVGASLAWVGIYASGILLIAGILPVWKQYRGIDKVKVAFKGFSSVAVGLVFAATYILIEKAITNGPKGSSLASYPFYVAVTGILFVLVEFLRVPAPLVVILGAVVGGVEYFVTK
ncbi:hypothetical protein HDU97_001647 [Phlyctochytrium planicorne]|nr:hypothetical protein HDU97_001647 [Phlyctochytrium planicorne]